jgi:hypothetical protein
MFSVGALEPGGEELPQIYVMFSVGALEPGGEELPQIYVMFSVGALEPGGEELPLNICDVLCRVPGTRRRRATPKYM